MTLSKSYRRDAMLAHSWHGRVLEESTVLEGSLVKNMDVILKINRSYSGGVNIAPTE